MSCKACSVKKAKRLATNKHVNNNKKVTRASKRILSDLEMIKAPQDSGITITDKNWHIVVDHYMGYKQSELYGTKSNFVEPKCKNLTSGKIMGNL